MVATRRNGRTRRERTNADNLKSQRLQPCARCGMRIDYSLPTGEPGAFNAGHIKSWIRFPEERENPANLQPEHARCGSSAQDDNGRSSVGATSRVW